LLPENLRVVREHSIMSMRPFLEKINQELASIQPQLRASSNNINSILFENQNPTLPFTHFVSQSTNAITFPPTASTTKFVLPKEAQALIELKKIAHRFLFSSPEELANGKCKELIGELQNLEKNLNVRFKNNSLEKDLLIKLLFILASYSRVQEYMDNVLVKLKAISKTKFQRENIRPSTAPSPGEGFTRGMRYSQTDDSSDSVFTSLPPFLNDSNNNNSPRSLKFTLPASPTAVTSQNIFDHLKKSPSSPSMVTRPLGSGSRAVSEETPKSSSPFRRTHSRKNSETSSDEESFAVSPPVSRRDETKKRTPVVPILQLIKQEEKFDNIIQPQDKKVSPISSPGPSTSPPKASPLKKIPPLNLAATGVAIPPLALARIEQEEFPSETRSQRSFSVTGERPTGLVLTHPPEEHPKLPRSRSLTELDQLKEPKKENADKKVVCRICEEEISHSLLKEHSKFCVIANQWDMIALADDENLTKVAHTLNEKIKQANKITEENNVSPKKQNNVDVDLLGTLKKIAQSASQADIIECMKLLVRLRETKKNDNIEDIAKELEHLLKEKIAALRNAELAVTNSPRLYRTESPRLLRSPRVLSPQQKTGSPEQPKGIPTIRDFKIVKVITEGAFGRVFLARKKRTNDVYAVKVLRKTDMIQKNQIKHVKAERNILARTQNDFVIKMYYAFQSTEYLYLVMEYANGGDLFSLLQKFGALDESMAKMYIAETVLALEYLHSQGIVHRDLKPDNLLIDKCGHVKLTDFGLSAIGVLDTAYLPPSAPANSLLPRSRGDGSTEQTVPPGTRTRRKLYSGVGTPDYLAPEILLGIGHDNPVDWWALGVMLYEFIAGVPPFSGESVEDIFQNILNLRYAFPDDMSPEARDLISKLLVINPDERFGSKGAEEVKSHPFFQGINWNTLLTQEPPFVPRAGPESTAYFEPREERFPIKDEYIKDIEESTLVDQKSDDFTFDGFWYVNFANLERKNMEFLELEESMSSTPERKRSNSF